MGLNVYNSLPYSLNLRILFSDAFNINILITAIETGYQNVLKILITISIVKQYKKISPEIKEKCKHVRYIGQIINYLVNKHLWNHLCVNTIS